jgi:hypothetical protein
MRALISCVLFPASILPLIAGVPVDGVDAELHSLESLGVKSDYFEVTDTFMEDSNQWISLDNNHDETENFFDLPERSLPIQSQPARALPAQQPQGNYPSHYAQLPHYIHPAAYAAHNHLLIDQQLPPMISHPKRLQVIPSSQNDHPHCNHDRHAQNQVVSAVTVNRETSDPLVSEYQSHSDKIE